MIECPVCAFENSNERGVCAKCGSNLTDEPSPLKRIVEDENTQKRIQHAKRSLLRALPSGLACSLATLILFYGLGSIWPRVQALVFERGWIPYIVIGLFGWSMAILLNRFRTVRAQEKVFDLNLLHKNPKIMPTNIDQVLREVEEKCRRHDVSAHENILVRRIRRALEHFKTHADVEATGELLRYSAEIDADVAESGYTILKVFIWAIPIFGFIGTVMGIGDAVQGFSAFIGGMEDISQLQEQLTPALGRVSGGLSLAFDTTLLALLLSVPTMVITSHSLNRDQEFLTEVETFCVEQLLTRLEEGIDEKTAAASPEIAIFDLFKEFAEKAQRLLTESLDDQVRHLSRLVSASLARYEQILTDPIKTLAVKLAEASFASDKAGRCLSAALDRSEKVSNRLMKLQGKVSGELTEVQPLGEVLKGSVDSLSRSVDSIAAQRNAFAALGEQWLEGFRGTRQELEEAMKENHEKLSEIRRQLGRPRPITLKNIELVEERVDREPDPSTETC